MNRAFLREDDETVRFDVREKEKIAVIGNAMGAGATLVATSMAKLVSMDKENAVAFVDIYNKRPASRLTFDVLGMDKRFAGRKYLNLHSIVQKGSIRGFTNIDERINWILPDAGSRIGTEDNFEQSGMPEMNTVDNLRLINNAAGNIIIYDIDVQSFFGDIQALEEILLDAERIIYLIDPMPSMLLFGEQITSLIKKLESRGKNICWVINKFNNGVNRRELFSFLKLKRYIQLPYLPQGQLYMCEYNCRIPYSCKAIRDMLSLQMEQIVNCHRKNTL